MHLNVQWHLDNNIHMLLCQLIPQMNRNTLKLKKSVKLDELTESLVLDPLSQSTWSMPSWVVPRFISKKEIFLTVCRIQIRLIIKISYDDLKWFEAIRIH